MPERSERQQDDPVRLAQLVQFPLRVVRMRLDLYDGRLDPGGAGDPLGALDVDVGESYRSGKPFVDKAFHRCPGFL